MNRTLMPLLLTAALALPCTAWAQPGERGPRPGRDGGPPNEQREADGQRGERGRPERAPVELPVEMIEKALVTIQQLHPDAEWLPHIAELVKADPEEAARALGRFPRILELIEARLNRPDEFALHVEQAQLMRQVFPLVRQYREARRENDQAVQDALRPQIRALVERVFETRIQMKRLEIARLRAQLAEAEQELAEVVADKQDQIDQRLEEMLDRDHRWRRGGGGGDGERRRGRDGTDRRQRD